MVLEVYLPVVYIWLSNLSNFALIKQWFFNSKYCECKAQLLPQLNPVGIRDGFSKPMMSRCDLETRIQAPLNRILYCRNGCMIFFSFFGEKPKGR